ncbi:succinylglutamate desuccinylase/aspartoacylase family protein [Schlesneria paludicola]|uniref:succinylglutamate desuccinylase/aspartoacylase family protein n=1 Tax=Schlesneria paludicola TaxID=360056 RepID=UPI00029A93DB|nr:M14 family metallopeptidase [Schlesneria paludicola]
MSAPLKQFEFSGAEPGPRLLITGAVHGDEFEPIFAIRRLISYFQDQATPPLARGGVTLIPVVNEAAFLRGHRCAEDGLDLARTCPGSEVGSITEQTAWRLSAAIRQADFYIDLHTGGTELAVQPLAGYMLHPNPHVLAHQRRMARAFNLPIIWGTSSELEGRSLSVARDAQVPAIYCEYLGSAVCDPVGIDAYFNGCLNVMAELGMLERTRAANLVEHVVENPRPNSGHMQVCNPSPVTGYFESHVTLGQPISRGESLGFVFPLDGGSPVPITATESGLVIVLRTFPRIREGESVGVILELTEG